ncbi:hypothetical protein TNCV_3383671 [Trichonephila clavipes]|uniref:Uncharacterized protein n=1 Tax=Trichonephila clavipes TaxID=2585209 RepID=A0A8X6VQU0_TRICX|nr:hypothetical protein TNCV_3383671 [Trichonephila clavipes]
MKNSLCYILFSLISVCLAVDPNQICPPEDRIVPCYCEKDCDDCRVSLKCDSLQSQEILSQVVNRSNGYQYELFELKGSNITFIPASIFETQKITSLKVWSTSMTSLFDRPPTTNLSDIYILLFQAVLPSIQWEMFQGIQNLRRLSVRHSQIPQLVNSFSNNVPKGLEELVIYECETESLDDRAFAPFDHLLEIRIEVGKVRELKRSMFPSPAKLQVISFSYNELESLPEDIFTDMPDLEKIYLRGNQLAELNENIFKPLLPRLDAFKVADNPLSCGCNMRWITSLERHHWTELYYVGSCKYPEELKNKALKDLNEADFSQCSQ